MKEYIIDYILTRKIIGPIIIIILAIIAYKVIQFLINKTHIKGKNALDQKRKNTILSLIFNIIKYVIATIAIVMILDIYGVDTTSIIAGLGVAGVVIGLAFQDALKDIINGINIVMDNYYVVGDLIRYNNFDGTVISFGLKTTKIKSETGEVLTVANRNISSVTNFSQKNIIMFFEVGTNAETDEKLVKKVIENIIKEISENEYVDQQGSMYLGIEKIKASSTIYLFQIKCFQGHEKELRREVNQKIKVLFQKNNIELKD